MPITLMARPTTMRRLAKLRLEGPAAAAARPPPTEEHDGLCSVHGLGSGDSALLADVLSPGGGGATPLPDNPADAVAALTAELRAAFEGGPRGPATNPPAAIVTAAAPGGGRFALYRYPAAGGMAPLVAAQLDWPAAPLVGAVRAAADAAAGTRSDHAVINQFKDGAVMLGAHSDKTLDLQPGSATVVVNIGAPRWLVLAPTVGRAGATQRLRLRHGSALVIGPETNASYTHEVLPEPTASESLAYSAPLERLSVTLRAVATQAQVLTPSCIAHTWVVRLSRAREATAGRVGRRGAGFGARGGVRFGRLPARAAGPRDRQPEAGALPQSVRWRGTSSFSWPLDRC